MSIRPGTRIGPYEVLAPLGAGGMGEVFRARDTRLGRDVAVKALPAFPVPDQDRIDRFAREGQILAGLNHPHIAALYGLEEATLGGHAQPARYLVLELLEGGTLADRLRRGALPVRASLEIARAIADALQTAHDKGIIHRDLKPANIAFTAEGHPKVLDFGLAKVYEDVAEAVTEAPALTAAGAVLGTAAYMSPEQARGLPLDRRSDIWSFGCVFYEMLTGRHPFAAETVSHILTRILSEEPDWSALPSAVPERVKWLLRRCLDKDPRRRLHDIADARIELEEALTPSVDSSAAAFRSSSRMDGLTVRGRERLGWIVAALTLAALALAAGVQSLRPPTGAAANAMYMWSLEVPQDRRLSADGPATFALSPDNTRLAFIGRDENGPWMLWIRPLDGLAARPIPGTEGASSPFWSPDGRAVAFVGRPPTGESRGQLKIVDVTGRHAVIPLATVAFVSTGAWSVNGTILFTPAGNAPLHRVSATGGTATTATTLDTSRGEVQHSYPSFLPDGEHFLYSVVGSAGGMTDIHAVYIGSLGSEEPPRRLIDRASVARFAGGRVMFLRDRTLFAQQFDPGTLTLRGEPVQVVSHRLAAGSGPGELSAFSATNDLLAYQPAPSVQTQLAWFDRSGKRLGELGGAAEYQDVVLSPDGSSAAVTIRDPELGTSDIWVMDLARGVRERVTDAPGSEFAPVWPPAGKDLVFSAARQGGIDLYRQLSGREEEKVAPGAPGLGKFGASWSPDGTKILYIAGGGNIARSDLMVLPLTGDRRPVTFVATDFVETQGRFSPDGRWIAYVARPSGSFEVYVRPFPGPGEPLRISASGGFAPQWRQDGTELFFMGADNQLMVASIDGRAVRLTLAGVRELFQPPVQPMPRLDAYPYGASPDGRRFLINTRSGDTAPRPITVILNWPALLR